MRHLYTYIQGTVRANPYIILHNYNYNNKTIHIFIHIHIFNIL